MMSGNFNRAPWFEMSGIVGTRIARGYDCTSSVFPPFTDESSPLSLKPYKTSSLARRASSRFLSSSTALFIDSEAVALGTAREPVNAAFCDHYAHTNANTRARVRMIGREIFRRAWARARGAAGDFQHKKPRHSPKQVTETVHFICNGTNGAHLSGSTELLGRVLLDELNECGRVC